MRDITSFADAIAAIWDRSGYDRGFISNPFAGDDAARLGLRRTRAVLEALGNPDRRYPIVHVAGSKGKGSTCIFIDGILRAAGLRCGRYLSPHLHSWRERFVVDDRCISEAEFVALTREAIGAARQVEQRSPTLGEITAFELSTAMALHWFAQSGCDVAVIEVGLGGTLDATNVIDPAVSVITPLDYEHTAILGETMTEIAGNKAGIIKPARPVVSAAQPSDGMTVIVERAETCDASLLIAGRDWTVSGTDHSFSASGPWGLLDHLRIPLAGPHQVENAGLALAAVTVLRDQDARFAGVIPASMRSGIAHVRHPGRFEEVRLDSGPLVIIDGAHSPASAAALAATMREHHPAANVTLVVGMLRDKSPVQLLDPLLDVVRQWVAVAPESPRALPAAELSAAATALGVDFVISSTVAEGISVAKSSGCDTILVTGSLVTAAEARVALGLT